MTAVLICGAGGFIGGHLTKRWLELGHDVRAVDRKPLSEWYQLHGEAQNLVLDLKNVNDAKTAVRKQGLVLNFAADMGGMGFITNKRVECLDSVLITLNVLKAAQEDGVSRVLYASSACVYPEFKQRGVDQPPLKESDAWPADPEQGYGLEKLYGEELHKHYRLERGLFTYVPRLHNVYGPYGTWTGGREKAPSAICRKVAEAKLQGTKRISIWGDGKQTRSFMYIDDCLEGVERILLVGHAEPINLGSSELVSIDGLVSIVEEIAGVSLTREYDLTAPQGVRGRNSDNTVIKSVLGWEPSTSLRAGLEKTYAWVFDQVAKSL